MEIAVDQFVPYIEVDHELENKIRGIREEISSAINSRRLTKDFSKDVCLSFGSIHVNPFGSVSEINFEGREVSDIDSFVVGLAMNSKRCEFVDLRERIRNNPGDFTFFPILSDGKVSLTVLKYSRYFTEMFGQDLVHDHERFFVSYTPKYMLVRVCAYGEWKDYCFLCGPFDIQSKFKRDMFAIRQYWNQNLYFCYTRTRPEHYSSMGECKEDFIYPPAALSFYKFYRSSLARVALHELKITNDNAKVIMKKTKAKFYQFIIELQYSSIKDFCAKHNVNYGSLKAYFAGATAEPFYCNGDKLTIARLEELLNLPFKVNNDSVKDLFLLEEVEYKDIPDERLAF